MDSLADGDARIADGAGRAQSPGVERPPRGDVRNVRVTNGGAGVTSGGPRWPAWAVGYAAIFAVTLVIGAVNVLSRLDERSWIGRPLDWWEPATWEGSSVVALLALAWVPLLMVRRFPPAGGAGGLRNLLLHALATLAFSLAHIGLMVALRHAAYALAGAHYAFGGLEEIVYEYRKDLIPYSLYAATFWLTERMMRPAVAPSGDAPVPDIVIDEGQRLLRVPPREVLCVRSSGNYAEFFLADGRRPLMRATLASLSASLADVGFVRTHRSWLVNPAHVVEIAAEGSGDHGLKLSDGGAVPLSRRYPQALARLRGDP